jgi:hypothetical protein
MVAVGCAAILCGCISVTRHERTPMPPQPQVGIPGDASDVATLAEIDAAARFTFDSDKVDILQDIARRPNLSPEAQIRMVRVACSALTFDSSKVDLLTAIVKGPSFCEPVRHAIVSQLECLTFDSSKSSVLRAVSHRVSAQRR